MEFDFGLIKDNRQTLYVTVGGVQAGYLDLGVADVNDPDDPKVRLDYAKVYEQFRDTGASVELVREVRARWPLARIVGGPLSHDDERGPRFRLNCWDAGVGIHQPNCQPGACECRARTVDEVARRYREWFEQGGLSSDQLKEKLALLNGEPA